MAKGDLYDARQYNWQVRETADGRIFMRYDSDIISSTNKGRYNTSPVVNVVSNKDNTITVVTQSGSQYRFAVAKCVFPMHLLSLTMKFGVEF